MDTRSEAPARVQPITFGGYQVAAPGFDEEMFASVVQRALADGLRVEPGRAPRTWLVTNPVSGHEYAANVHGCTCAAGHHRSLCKHLALTLLLDAILTPVDRLGGAS